MYSVYLITYILKIKMNTIDFKAKFYSFARIILRVQNSPCDEVKETCSQYPQITVTKSVSLKKCQKFCN